jgi:uroporphyrinogen decarboxylase
VFWRALQYTLIDEEVLTRFGSDGRPLLLGAAPSTLERELSENSFIDNWGITWQRTPGNYYFEIVKPPLQNATVDDIEKYPWPELAHPIRFEGLAARARAIRDAGYAVVALSEYLP